MDKASHKSSAVSGSSLNYKNAWMADAARLTPQRMPISPHCSTNVFCTSSKIMTVFSEFSENTQVKNQPHCVADGRATLPAVKAAEASITSWPAPQKEPWNRRKRPPAPRRKKNRNYLYPQTSTIFLSCASCYHPDSIIFAKQVNLNWKMTTGFLRAS